MRDAVNKFVKFILKAFCKLANQFRSSVVGFRPGATASAKGASQLRIERDIDRTVSFRSSQGTAVRGTLSKLSRRNIVFEIYNPFSPIQTSEVLTDLKVRRGKDVVYQGDAVVTGVVTTSILVVVSATLVSKWSALDAIVSESAGIRSEVAHFIDEWERVNKLDPNYQLKVADLRSFLSDLSFWLDQVDLAAEGEHGAPP